MPHLVKKDAQVMTDSGFSATSALRKLHF